MTPPTSRRASLFGLVALALVASFSASPLHAQPNESVAKAQRAFELTTRLDLDAAKKELEGTDPEVAEVAITRARLAVYTGDCDEAVALLGRSKLGEDDEARALADVARGCARVTAALVVKRDTERQIEVQFQDEHDVALYPLLVDTIEKARTRLTQDLGVDWPKPTRFVVVRDHLSLSAMTGLPYESARTTGTVAVAKWGKVTLLSPRAAHHGYGWRDTVAHELTHLAVTRASADRAPLWLQEGLAKREEIRWRAPGPFDDRPSPEAIVQRGIEKKLDLPLDKLGPSIAMLPSADAAMVAFAEVTSFVRFFADHTEAGTVPKLLGALKNGQTIDDALRTVSQRDLVAWDVEWRAFIAKHEKLPLDPAYGFGAPPKNLKDARERLRLAELLLLGGHGPAALLELDGITAPELTSDPSYRALRGRALEASGKGGDAYPLVADPKDVPTPHAPWWALRGRVLEGRGDGAGAGASFAEALADDPFDPEIACRPGKPGPAPDDPALCGASKPKGDALTAD